MKAERRRQGRGLDGASVRSGLKSIARYKPGRGRIEPDL